MLRGALDGHAVLPPFRYFLEHIVIANDDAFTILVIIGEIAVGGALILGLLTRPAALAALFMNLNFLLLNGFTLGGLIDATWILLELFIIAFAARQRWSVDGWLRHGQP